MKLALRKGTKAQAMKAIYEQCAGLKLGDFLDSSDYRIDNEIDPVPEGAWIKAWVFVSKEDISDLNEEDSI